MNKISLISLGCAKNLVDSEMILGLTKKMGYEITPFVSESNLIIINTCGFIESAKQESINKIFEVLSNKKEFQKVIVVGCLSTRYKDELTKEIPEVDAFVSIKDYKDLGLIIENVLKDKKHNMCMDFKNRILSTPIFSAYVRIGDGCDNKCSYCAIPLIRGGFNSRRIKDVVEECKNLAKNGRKEIVLIAQDTTRFGIENNERIEDLLKELECIDEIKMIRLLYLYPDEISDELIDIISSSSKICHYFDIPIQHASNHMLKLMNRRGSKEHIKSIIDKIRAKCNDAIIRTTVLVGFPYETDEDFNELVEFIKEIRFDRLGCFTYSKEEDTKGYEMEQVDENIKQLRFNKIMEIQKEIATKLSNEKIEKTYKCFVERYDPYNKKYLCRSYAFSGDEVDGYIIIDNSIPHNIGDYIDVKITNSYEYDLEGIEIKKS